MGIRIVFFLGIGAVMISLFLLPGELKLLSAGVGTILAAAIGYLAGHTKVFLEQKQQAYRDIAVHVIPAMFFPEDVDQKAFNGALAAMWMYADKKAAKTIDEILAIFYKNDKELHLMRTEVAEGRLTKQAYTNKADDMNKSMIELMQKAFALMRADMQRVNILQKLKAKEIGHFQSRWDNRRQVELRWTSALSPCPFCWKLAKRPDYRAAKSPASH